MIKSFNDNMVPKSAKRVKIGRAYRG